MDNCPNCGANHTGNFDGVDAWACGTGQSHRRGTTKPPLISHCCRANAAEAKLAKHTCPACSSTFMGEDCPWCETDDYAKRLTAAEKELDRFREQQGPLRAYVGDQTKHSDFRTAGEMRAELDRARQELTDAKAVLSRLHRTADNVAAVPGDTVSCNVGMQIRDGTVRADENSTWAFFQFLSGDGPGATEHTAVRDVGDCYSTDKAAQAAGEPNES